MNTGPTETPTPSPNGNLSLGDASDKIGALNLFADEVNTAEPSTQGEEVSTSSLDEDRLESENTDSSNTLNNEDSEQEELEGSENDNDDRDIDASENTDETLSFDSLTDLAKAMDVDIDYFNDLEVTLKADGEEKTVTFDELKRSYQKDTHYHNNLAKVKEMESEVTTKETERAKQYEQSFAQVGHALQSAHQLLVGEIDNAEMTRLRAENPEQYLLRREDIQRRMNGVQQHFNNLSLDFDAYHKQKEQEQLKTFEERKTAELAKLQDKLPDWGAEKRTEIIDYLGTNFGFAHEELQGLVDHRLIVLAEKARLYDRMKAVGEKTKQKVAKVPKIQKPGKVTSISPKTKAVKDFSRAKKVAQKSGSVRDAADAIGKGDFY